MMFGALTFACTKGDVIIEAELFNILKNTFDHYYCID